MAGRQAEIPGALPGGEPRDPGHVRHPDKRPRRGGPVALGPVQTATIPLQKGSAHHVRYAPLLERGSSAPLEEAAELVDGHLAEEEPFGWIPHCSAAPET